MSQTWHYVKHASVSRQPRRHVFIDTEARQVRTPLGYEQTWRVGVAIFRHAPKKGKLSESERIYRDATAMWRDVDAFTTAKGRTILWTHNLGYDLRISKALSVLPGLGWSVMAQNLTPGGTWIVWRRGDRSIVMVDSASVFPTTIAQLAKSFQTEKLPLPAQSDSDDSWVRRCRKDVQILRDGVVAYLDRLETLDLGTWQMTGTGQAWAAFRHRFLAHDMLVHWDEDARSAERRAMWAGRCEAYWHGRATSVRIDEWDMTLAYPRIALTAHVPVALAGAFTTTEDMHRWMNRDGYTVLAEVEVTTSQPLVPCERDNRICWPVGTFRTVLWGPEIALLRRGGQRVDVSRGWVYRTAPALSDWASWIISQMAADDARSPAWWKMILKHWARALIGRMAMTYREWERAGISPHADVRRSSYVDVETGETGEVMQIGRDMFVATQTVEWPESLPMITGWIQSQCRAILTQMIIEAGDRVVLYTDTDSMLVSGEHYEHMAALASRHPDAGLRLKRSWTSVEIRGPRQLVTGARVRISGLPHGSQRLADGSFSGEVWQSLQGSVTSGRATSVRITPRRWHLRATDMRRQVGEGGWTVPHQVELTVATSPPSG